jgi:hypothetical protein
LQEEQVPQVWWTRLVNSSKDGNEVILEGSDGAFVPIAMMHVWRDKLELGTPCKGDCLFEGSAGVVVHDLDINQQPSCSQMSHDDVVGSKTMWASLLVLKGCWRIRLPSAWYAIMIYWLPERALTGKQPVSSV